MLKSRASSQPEVLAGDKAMAAALLDRMRFESLHDGTVVRLRPPKMDDLERSLAFFRGLPETDRRYLRFDVTRREVVERVIREALEKKACRVLALDEDEVVGHGALEVSRDTWQRHIGEIRVLVAPEVRRRGLGTILISRLFKAAEKRGVKKVVVRLAGPQFAARTVLERLGFLLDGVLKDHVTDAEGEVHDLMVMSCDLDEVSRTLRKLYRDDDWPDCD